MIETEAREEICRIGKSLFERGYVHATAGNISVRLPDGGFLITPTDACLGFLSPDRLAKLDSQGTQISGDRASKTITLHRRIYEASSNTGAPAGCVIHTHSSYCVALTLDEKYGVQSRLPTSRTELLPAITPYFVMKVGHVPLISYRRPGSSDTAEEVATTIRNYDAAQVSIRAVMLSRLGPNVWHETPAQAMATLEELEETAKLWYLSSAKSVQLSSSALEDLRETFNAIW